MNKASGSDRIPVELFQILEDDTVKVLHSIGQQIWKIQQWPQDWKRSVSIPIPKKGNAKKCSNYCIIALISHTSNITLKILVYELRTSRCTGWIKKRQRNQDQIANIRWIIEKSREFLKNICFIDYTKTFDCNVTTNYGKFLKRREYLQP